MRETPLNSFNQLHHDSNTCQSAWVGKKKRERKEIWHISMQTQTSEKVWLVVSRGELTQTSISDGSVKRRDALALVFSGGPAAAQSPDWHVKRNAQPPLLNQRTSFVPAR